MPKPEASRFTPLDLKAGEWVEVRAEEEILATLDECGCTEHLPFMPEMLSLCGKRFRVGKRADKTCDNIEPWSIRRMTNAVHLEGVRCNGEAHGGCQAGCLIFWKEAWLKRAGTGLVSPTNFEPSGSYSAQSAGLCTEATIVAASSRVEAVGETLYSCQATELLKFTSPMVAWDPRQYIRDVRSGILSTGLAHDSPAQRVLEKALGILQIARTVVISLFNRIQQKRHWRPTFPFIEGSAAKTPLEVLDLQPGELVQVRSQEEIIATLDKQNRNRGLLFDGEMLTYCGGIYRVLRRVDRIVDEKTGKMMEMKNPCIVLEGVACRSDYHRLCPRAIYHYWRESWLKRAADASSHIGAAQLAETCDKC